MYNHLENDRQGNMSKYLPKKKLLEYIKVKSTGGIIQR